MEVDGAVRGDRHHDEIGPLITGTIRVEVRRAGERRPARAGAEKARHIAWVGHGCHHQHRGIHRRDRRQSTATGHGDPHKRQRRADAARVLVRRRNPSARVADSRRSDSDEPTAADSAGRDVEVAEHIDHHVCGRVGVHEDATVRIDRHNGRVGTYSPSTALTFDANGRCARRPSGSQACREHVR